MAADFSKPINTTAYSDVYAFLRDNIDLVATWYEDVTGATNIQTNAKRFSITNKRFEYWSGSAWLELLAKATTAYDIRAAVADLADTATSATTAGACTGNSATASLATNSLQLGGVVASSYTLNSEIRSIFYGGTGSNTDLGARTNLGVYSKTEGDARYLLESNNLSDLTHDATARTNLDVYSKSESDAKYTSSVGGSGGATGQDTYSSAENGTHIVTLGFQPTTVSILKFIVGGTNIVSATTATITSTGFLYLSYMSSGSATYTWTAFK